MEQLPELPAIERLSARVIRILGGNPGKFTLQGTNTYLIGTGSRRLLLDTGEGRPVWKESLAKVLKDEGVSVEKVLLSHWHHDHVSGVKDVLDLHASSNKPKPEIFKSQISPGEDYEFNFESGHTFTTEGATLKAFHCPGHTVDHMAFILQEENAMFTADNVLGHGTAVFEDLSTYMSSLESMHPLFTGRAYPGHGAVIEDGPGKIKEYIAHRKAREQEALKLLSEKSGDRSEWWGSMEMVKVIYAKYPEHLWGPAEGSLLHVLRKLEGEGRVRRGADGRWAGVEKAAL